MVNQSKLFRFIDKHPIVSMWIIIFMILLSVFSLGIAMSNIDNENQQKVMDTFESLSCEQLVKIPSQFGYLMIKPLDSETENKFLISWNDNMQRCLK